jgi:hypothetical protein
MVQDTVEVGDKGAFQVYPRLDRQPQLYVVEDQLLPAEVVDILPKDLYPKPQVSPSVFSSIPQSFLC